MTDEFEREVEEWEGGMTRFKSFGFIVTQWATLESSLEEVIWGLLRLPPFTGMLITSPMNYSGKNDLLRAMISHPQKLKVRSESRVLPILSDVLDEAKILNDLRNLVAHSLWVPGKPRETIDDMFE
jgi:hypothetical protein